jgi:hypothetical protein
MMSRVRMAAVVLGTAGIGSADTAVAPLGLGRQSRFSWASGVVTRGQSWVQ